MLTLYSQYTVIYYFRLSLSTFRPRCHYQSTDTQAFQADALGLPCRHTDTLIEMPLPPCLYARTVFFCRCRARWSRYRWPSRWYFHFLPNYWWLFSPPVQADIYYLLLRAHWRQLIYGVIRRGWWWAFHWSCRVTWNRHISLIASPPRIIFWGGASLRYLSPPPRIGWWATFNLMLSHDNLLFLAAKFAAGRRQSLRPTIQRHSTYKLLLKYQ